MPTGCCCPSSGKPLLGLQCFYPNLITQSLCLSYNGTMWMNFVVDPDVITDGESLTTLYIDTYSTHTLLTLAAAATR